MEYFNIILPFVIGNYPFDAGVGHSEAQYVVTYGEDRRRPVTGIELTTEPLS